MSKLISRGARSPWHDTMLPLPDGEWPAPPGDQPIGFPPIGLLNVSMGPRWTPWLYGAQPFVRTRDAIFEWAAQPIDCSVLSPSF